MDPAIERPAKKGHSWLLLIGGVLALIGLVLCGFGGFATYGHAKEIGDAPMVTGSQTVHLDEGESAAVWSEVEGNACSATGPSGAEVSDSGVGTQSLTWGDREMHRAMQVEATRTGDHTITCAMPFVVGESVSWSGVAMAVVGGGLGCLAVVLVAIGLSLWLVRRKR